MMPFSYLFRRAAAVLAATLGLVAGLPASPAAADWLTGSITNGPGGYANGRVHYWTSVETNEAHWGNTNHFMFYVMKDQYGAKTDVIPVQQTRNLVDSGTDVVFVASPQANLVFPDAIAETTCTRRSDRSNVCNRFQIQFSEQRFLPLSDWDKYRTTCHEIAHTLGLVDGSQETVGCFPRSRFSSDVNLSQHEITGAGRAGTHINDRY